MTDEKNHEMIEMLADPKDGPREENSSRPAWGKWEWMLLLSAFAAAGCYFFCHFPYILRRYSHLPGVGLTLTQWLLIASALTAAGKKGRFRANRGGVFLLIISLGLGACYAIFGNDSLRAMNLPVVSLSTALALFSLTGTNPLPPLSSFGLCLGLRRFLPAFVQNWAYPLRAAASLREKNGASRLKGLGVGLILGLPIAGIALGLLLSADSVFDGLIQDAVRSLPGLDGAAVRLLLSVIGGLCLFSFLFSLKGLPAPVRENKDRACSPVTLSTVLSLLCAVYALFVYVQFRYLFGGAEEARMAGGYAEYARSGFFQLVILSMLTLLLILPVLHLGRKSVAVRCLCALTALLTVVIVFSAFFRMRLYIQSFGLSVLRVVTLWGMAMILLALVAAMVKCCMPDRKICPTLTVLALSSWLMLNCLNVDGMVAGNQVGLYNGGVIEEIDVPYLASLSPDVLPALQGIRDGEKKDEILTQAADQLRLSAPVPYDWALCWLSMPAEQ